MGDGKGKGIRGIGNSIYAGTEAENDMACLGTKGQWHKENLGTCVPLLRTASSAQQWTSTRVKSVCGGRQQG